MADKDKQAGPSNLGGARTAGVRNGQVQATYDRLSQYIKEKWNIPDVLDTFPASIRPKSLGASAIANLKNIAAKKTLAEAQALFVHECQGRDGHLSKVGWQHTDKIWKAIKDDTASPRTTGSSLDGSTNTPSSAVGTNKSTPKAVPIDHSIPNPEMEMRFKKKPKERAPKETPPLIDPRTDPRSAPFATPTSTTSYTPTPKFDEPVRATTNPIGFLEPKASPVKKGRAAEEVGNTQPKQPEATQEKRFDDKTPKPHNISGSKKLSQAQGGTVSTPVICQKPLIEKRKQADIQKSKGPAPPIPTNATSEKPTATVVQSLSHISKIKKKSSDAQEVRFKEPIKTADDSHAFEGSPKKRKIAHKEIDFEDIPDTQATLVDDGIDLSRESPIAKKPRLSPPPEAAAQKGAGLSQDINELIALNEQRIAEINEKNARSEADSWTKKSRTISDEPLTPTKDLLESLPTTKLTKKGTLYGSSITGGKQVFDTSTAIGLPEEIKKRLGSLPASIKGFLGPPNLMQLDKEDVDRKLLARINSVLATAARHLEADLAWLFKERADR